ncbi:hypothetical protein J1605_014727 [Eschrichtius robustus]|uniref:Myotilin n=1 Tax=Eschrichtius robustus TaxID=9764 RepID=A0AB34GC90_ESCRO|nr:hypothetical protein J1605_014727 [Eschrichtius robustus]
MLTLSLCFNFKQHNSEHARLQVPTSQVRSRSSSRGDVNDQDAIQEKFYPPRFIQVPENMSIEEGRFCRMDFKVSGLPAPDVSWYLNGRPVQSDDFHKMIVSEKGFHSLIFEVVRASDAGAYTCVAKNRAGEATFTVQLDVLAKEHRRAPMFIYKPQSKKVFEGDSVKLECQISAIPPPKLFWKRNNEMVQFNTDRISLYHDNSGRVTLLIKDVNKKDAGWYTVSAVNEAGVTTCNTRLDVTARPNQTPPAPKQLRVRPTFSKYLALNGKGLDVKQAFNPEGEFQRLAAQSGLYESEEL